MNKIIITGGTGLVGARLAALLLKKGYEVVIMSRNCDMKRNEAFKKLHELYNESLQCAIWDTDKRIMDAFSVKTSDVIVNLAGAGVADERWTDERKKELVSSRVNANETIIHALSTIPNNVKTIINAAAIGWYGDDKDRPELTPFTEDAAPAQDFLAQTCVQWEQSIDPVAELGKRLVKYRIGIVLGNGGGAYPQFRKTLQLRVASVMGHGRQIVSWIHIDDLCAMIVYAIENEGMEGVYNAVAPFSVTNEKLVRTIAEAIHRQQYASLKVPKTILKIALGEMSTEVLKSTLVSSKKILSTGFTFDYPRIKDAVAQLESEK